MDALDALKNSIFLKLRFSGVKSILFYPEHQKANFSGLICPKSTFKKNQFFDKNHALTPLENLDILEFLKLHFSGLKSILFYPEHKKHNLSKKYP